MSRGSVRLVLVDDRPLFCRGLQLLLPSVTGDRVQVTGSTGDASAAAGLVRRHRPDLVLVDLALPAPGGVRAIGAIRRTEPAVPVVALGRPEQPEPALSALKAGAAGLLPAGTEPEDLVAPLLSVVDGYAVLPAGILDRLIDRAGTASSAVARLSAEEREVALQLPFVSEARYVGRYGWVTADVTDEDSLASALEWLRESYWLKAPADVRDAALR